MASGVAVGVRRAVAAFQPHLVRQVALRPFDEKVRVELDAASRLRIELHHPTVAAVVIELLVDGAVERVGEIDPPAVAADLPPLRPAGEMAVPRPRMGGARDDAADANLSGEPWVER